MLGSDEIGPAALSKELDMPKSTAHDYLRTLETTGYAVHDDEGYRLSTQFLSIGGRHRNRNRFYQAARTEVKRLANETGELPNIGIEEDGEIIILQAVRGDQSLSLGIYPGLRIPLHSNAGGKVHLAYLPEKYVEEYVHAGELEQVTEDTITDVDLLTAQLETIREQGHNVALNEQVLGMGTISVPILVNETIIGAISISAAAGRLQDEEFQEELFQKLREAANTIMVSYQYGP